MFLGLLLLTFLGTLGITFLSTSTFSLINPSKIPKFLFACVKFIFSGLSKNILYVLALTIKNLIWLFITSSSLLYSFLYLFKIFIHKFVLILTSSDTRSFIRALCSSLVIPIPFH